MHLRNRILFLMILLCLGIQPVQAKGVWILTETKCDIVKDPSYTPARWIAGRGGVAAEKRWSSPSGDSHSVILANFTWSGIPETISEGQEYQLSVVLDQKANSNTGVDPWLKIYSAVEGGAESDGPDATTSWRQSSSLRKATGRLIAPKSSGQRMYIRVQCKIHGDYYHVRYCYSLQGNKPNSAAAPKLSLGGGWTCAGRPTSISQDGGGNLLFTNEFGQRSKGRFADSNTVIATEWEGGLRGSLQDGAKTIRWANGTAWSRK